MISRIALGTALTISLVASSAWSALPVPTAAPVTDVFSPEGFDTNDDTQVVVSGYLPDMCHKAQKVESKVTGRTVSISVQALLDESADFCLQMLVPFLEPVSLGVLSEGTYRVVVNGGTAREKTGSITVVPAKSPNVDNYIYAHVSYVHKTLKSRKIKIVGENPSDCLQLDHIEYVSNGKDTFSVLPIMKQIKKECPVRPTPFAYETEVPRGLAPEWILLHVRSMDGKSVSTLLDNRY